MNTHTRQNHNLNRISFRWILRKAIAVGLPIDPAIADGLAVDPGAEIRPAKMDVIKNKPRKLTASDRMHYTGSARSDEKQSNPPAGCPVESQEDERKRLTLA